MGFIYFILSLVLAGFYVISKIWKLQTRVNLLEQALDLDKRKVERMYEVINDMQLELDRREMEGQ